MKTNKKHFAKIADLIGSEILPVIMVVGLVFGLLLGLAPGLRALSLSLLWTGAASFLMIWPLMFWAEKQADE